MWFYFVLLITSLLDRSQGTCCKSSGIICRDPLTYQLCASVNNKVQLIGEPRTCPEGTICDDEGLFSCKVGTLPPPTTTPLPVTEPTCSGAAKFPSSTCNQYYECVPVWWWWEPILSDCPNGQNYDPSLEYCVSAELVRCGGSGSATTTTTTTTPLPQPPVIEPTCSGAAKYPSSKCSQYYECVPVWWWWESILSDCPNGQNFDPSLESCVSAELVRCGGSVPATTTTTSTTTTTTPTSTTLLPQEPITEPECSGAVKYPTTTCNQYYECVPVWWWWEPTLKECPSGQNFDPVLENCFSADLVKCNNGRIAATAATSTTSSTTASPQLPVIPEVPTVCNGANRYPGPQPNQYYECVYAFLHWTPYLYTCEGTQLYDSVQEICSDNLN